MNRFALGVAAALAGAVLWGISGTFMQFLLHDYQVSKCFIAAFRMVVAGVLFALLLAVRKRDALRRLLKDGRSLAKIALQGFVGLFMCQLTYMLAIDYTNAGTATVLQSLNVLFVLFVACRLAHRLPRSMECVAVLCALVATSLIATKGDFGTLQIPVQGLLWGLTSALTVTFSVTFSKHLFEQWDSTVVTGVAMMAGGVFAIVFLFCAAAISPDPASVLAPQLDAAALGALLVIAVLGTFCSFGLYLFGVSVVGSVKGSLLNCVEPVCATVFTALWLQTVFTWADVVGMLLMIVTVFIVSLQPRQQ